MEINTTLRWKLDPLEECALNVYSKRWTAYSLIGTFSIYRDKEDIHSYSLSVATRNHLIYTDSLDNAKKIAQEQYDTLLSSKAEYFHGTS
uniref:Uncharacterized protein n=1 Tax=Podoviridae sp. ctz6O13 TaxID=2827757 RepID=A0A8S5TL56_9CAUD|nr:MAG TPA: hypothetical protein [Podoviridae sp. ctz6O13]